MSLVVLVLAPVLLGQSQSELRVKAAYVFNITKFVEFSTPRDHLVVGVVGDGPIVETLRSELSGKLSESRAISVVVSPSDERLPTCDLLYVAWSSSKKVEAMLQKAAPYRMLTVGDAATFAEQGGVIGLVTVGDRVNIRINLEASRKANLKISSRLLNLATVVESSDRKR